MTKTTLSRTDIIDLSMRWKEVDGLPGETTMVHITYGACRMVEAEVRRQEAEVRRQERMDRLYGVEHITLARAAATLLSLSLKGDDWKLYGVLVDDLRKFAQHMQEEDDKTRQL